MIHISQQRFPWIFAVLTALAVAPVAISAEKPLPADSAKGRDLLKQGDALADKKQTTEAVLQYKLAFEQLLPGMRKVKFKEIVKRDVTAREALGALLLKEFETDMTPGEFRANELALKTLGLIPIGYDLKGALVTVYSEEIAAFYDPKTKTMHLIKEPEKPSKKVGFLETLLGKKGGFDKDENKTVIAHELTHALADQNFDLTALQKAAKGDDDRSLAVSSLIEGEATMTMLGASMQDWAGDKIVAFPAADLDRTFSLIGPMMLIGSGKNLRDAPPILSESMIFPYLRGLVFCAKLVNDGGWAALDAAYHNPPISTEQILHPEKYQVKTYDAPTAVDLGKLNPGTGWTERGRNVLGEMQISVMLRQNGGKAAAAGWDGDRYAVFENANGALGLVWLSTWDSEDDAREFARGYLKFQTAKLGKDIPHPDALPDSVRRPSHEKVFAVERRGSDVAIVEGFVSDATESLLESAFASKKVEMTPAWIQAEAAVKKAQGVKKD